MAPVLVAGFHRSGTSWVARALHDAGVHFGDDLLAAEANNPYGHFEDVGVIALHDSALQSQQLTWKSPVQLRRPCSHALTDEIREVVRSRDRHHDLWAVKDPRICLFLPEWLEVAPQSRIIVVFRRPDEVVQSLHRRHARRWVDTRHIDPSDTSFWEQPDLGLQLWVHYNEQLLDALQDVSDTNIHVVDWNNELATSALVSTVASKWSIDITPTETARDHALGRAATQTLEVRDSSLIDRANSVWQRFHRLHRAISL